MTISAIIIVLIITIIPLVVAILYYWMIFFLWMNMICCTLNHLWSSVFLRKTIHMETTLSVCNLHPVSHLQTLLISAKDPAATLVPLTMDSRAWLENSNIISAQTHFFSFLDDLLCSPAVYGLCTLSIFAPRWFISTFITSVSDCLLLQQDVVSNILTDVVGESYSDSNWTTTALLHQWYPWCPAHSMLVIWM